MSYHTDEEADRLAVVYRDAILASLKGAGSERSAKVAENAYGDRLSALGMNQIQIARAMREIVRDDVVPLLQAHRNVTSEPVRRAS